MCRAAVVVILSVDMKPMTIWRNWSAVIALLASAGGAGAHDENARVIRFPDLPDYVTLVSDLHQHTVFSDGAVWPDIRVQEGVRDGVDVMAITDHLEYQPHRDDIPHPDRNRSHQLAREAAGSDIMVIPGAEVTRGMPPGHLNAVFITDANRLLIDDPVDALREAKAQGAFIYWNHPSWASQAPDGIARLTEMHHRLIAEGLLHGIEVVNEFTYADEALQIALDHDLTIMGTSDIHGLIDWEYNRHPHQHRPVTLVFARERTPAAVKAALLAGRTVVWYGETLIGREEWMQALLAASLTVEAAGFVADSSVLNLVLSNRSDADLALRNTSDLTFYNLPDTFRVPAQASTELQVKTSPLAGADVVTLAFEVLNAVTAPGEHPVVERLVSMNDGPAP